MSQRKPKVDGETIIETKHVRVVKDIKQDETRPYTVLVNGEIRHPNSTAEDVIRALACMIVGYEEGWR